MIKQLISRVLSQGKYIEFLKSQSAIEMYSRLRLMGHPFNSARIAKSEYETNAALLKYYILYEKTNTKTEDSVD